MARSLLIVMAMASYVSATEAHAIMAETSCMNLIERKANFDKLTSPVNGLPVFERDYDTMPRERRFRIMRGAIESAAKDLAWFARAYRWSEFEPAVARANSIMAYYDAGQANEGSMLASIETLKSGLAEALRRSKVADCAGAGPLVPVCQAEVVRPAPAPRELPRTGLNFESDVAR